MQKPKWKDAPKWAKFVAQDRSGQWWWYEKVPKKKTILWDVPNGKLKPATDNPKAYDSPRWKESFESRSEAKWLDALRR